MATYDELISIANTIQGDALRNRLRMAIAVKAQALIDSAPTATQLQWANEALADPISKIEPVLYYMLSNNKAAAVSAITTASDSFIQSNADAAVAALVP